MLYAGKAFFIVATSVALMLPAATPAYAFQLAKASVAQAGPTRIAAFADGAEGDNATNVFLLTDSEVRHVQWCAARYPSYHATDNTVLDQRRKRIQCVSPN